MQGARILMIDDDHEFCSELSELLTGEGYRVSTAYDGAAGMKLAGALDYDVLLLDLRLPLVNGMDILRSMRPHRDSVGIIVMSGDPIGSRLAALSPVPDPGELLQVAHRVFQKPFGIEDLLQAIQTLSDRYGAREPGASV
jgi:DNA-binding response OmpR family regulator